MNAKRPQEVEFRPLGELVEIVTKRNLAPYNRRKAGRWVSISNLPRYGEGEAHSSSHHAGEEGIPFEIGDILIGRQEPSLQRIWVASFDGICAPNAIIVVRPGPHIDPRYLFQVLLSSQVLEFLLRHDSVGMGSRISSNVLNQVPIPVPSLSKQEQWRALFDKINAARSLRFRSRLAIEELLGAVFLHLFDATNGPPLRELIRQVRSGVALKTWDRTMRSDECGLLRPEALESGVFSPQRNSAIRQGQRLQQEQELLRGSLVLCHSGMPWQVGSVALVDADFPYLAASEQMWVLMPGRGVPVSFLKGMFSTTVMRQRIRDLGTSHGLTIKAHLKQREFLALPGVVPTSPQLSQYDTFFESILPTMTALREQAQELDTLSRAIRAMMVRGAEAASVPSPVDLIPRFVPPNRPVWKHLSATQRKVWELACTLPSPLTIDALLAGVGRDHRPHLHEEHLLGVLDVLVTLGVVVPGGQLDQETWRVPDKEESEVL